MVVQTKAPAARPQTVELYLGFLITQEDEMYFVATPSGWTHSGAILEASDLPTLRKRIWVWWHRPLD